MIKKEINNHKRFSLPSQVMQYLGYKVGDMIAVWFLQNGETRIGKVEKPSYKDDADGYTSLRRESANRPFVIYDQWFIECFPIGSVIGIKPDPEYHNEIRICHLKKTSSKRRLPRKTVKWGKDKKDA